MEKIEFENGQLVQNGYVMIDGVKHEITEAIYNGKIPLSAETLNKLQDNIEKAIGDIKAEDITFTDGETFQEKCDNGELKGEKGNNGEQGVQGEEGYSPTITEKTNTDTEYVLTVTNKEGSFDTPNLKGATGQSGTGGETGTTNYEELTNKPKINNVELFGNKSLRDFGIDAVKSETLTLLDTNWVQNETTGYYEYNVVDDEITVNYVVNGNVILADAGKIGRSDTESYNGGFKVRTSAEVTENVTIDFLIQKTTPKGGTN